MYALLSKYFVSTVSIVLVTLFLVACGGSSDGGSTDNKVDLSGTYFGTMKLSGSFVETVINISGNQVTSVIANNSNIDYSATISNGTEANIFSVIANDGSEGGFIRSSNGNQLAFIAEGDASGPITIGIVTKATNNLPGFVFDDFVGKWAGRELLLDVDFNIMDISPSTVTINVDQSFSGTGLAPSGFSSTDAALHPNSGDKGIGTATTVIEGKNYSITTLMSADKQALANMACENNVESFDTCTFAFYSKDSGGGGTGPVQNPPANLYGLVNLEIQDLPNGVNGIFQLLLGELTVGTEVACTVTHPFQSDLFTCNPGSYDDTTKILTLTGTVQVAPAQIFDATLILDFSNDPDISAKLVAGTPPLTLPYFGSAIKAERRMRMNTNRHQSGYDYTVVSLSNVNPLYGKAVLYGVSTGPLVLWDNSIAGSTYKDKYNSYVQSEVNDGIPQSTGAYIAINTTNQSAPFNSGDYEIVLSEYVGDPTVTETIPTTGPFNYTNATAATLFNSSGVPPVRSQISISGTSGTIGSYGNPHIIPAGAFTVTWADTLNSSIDRSSIYWQVRFRSVGTSGSDHLNHTEIRTVRMLDGEGGLAYNAANIGQEWSWTATPASGFVLDPVNTVKIQMRVSNSGGSLRGMSQGMFVTLQ